MPVDMEAMDSSLLSVDMSKESGLDESVSTLASTNRRIFPCPICLKLLKNQYSWAQLQTTILW